MVLADNAKYKIPFYMLPILSQQNTDFVARLQAMFGVGDDGKIKEDVTSLRYVLYARKSTDDSGKQERSIGDQIHECKRLAERDGLRIVTILHEEKSAKLSENRPIFRSMLDEIEKGTYDAILTWAPDRLARNMKDSGEILDRLDTFAIKDIKFANGYYFQNDAAGKMMLGMAFVMAKQFIDVHSQNVRRGMTRITAEGKIYDRPKHGYFKDINGFARPDGENWQLMKKVFEMRLSCAPKYSLREIATWLRKQGYPVKTKHTKRRSIVINEKFLSDFLRDPFYAGAHIRGSQIVNLAEKYDFEPIITPEQFDKLTSQDGINKKFTLAEAIKPKGLIKADLFRGMVTCAGCDRYLSTGITSKKSPKGTTNYFYLRCDTKDCRYKGKSIRAKEVLSAAYAFIDKHPMNFEKGFDAYKREMERVISIRDAELLSKERSSYKQWESRKKRVDETKVLLKQYADDTVLEKEFKNDLRQHISRQKELEREIHKIKKQRTDGKRAYQSYEEFIELFGNLAQRIKILQNMEDLDFVLRKVFLNFVVEGKKVTKITQNSPFRELCGSPHSAMVAPKKLVTNFLRLNVNFLPIIKTCTEDIFAFLSSVPTRPQLAVTY